MDHHRTISFDLSIIILSFNAFSLPIFPLYLQTNFDAKIYLYVFGKKCLKFVAAMNGEN